MNKQIKGLILIGILIMSNMALAQENLPDNTKKIKKEVAIESRKSDAKDDTNKARQTMIDILNLSRKQITQLQKHRNRFQEEKVKIESKMTDKRQALNTELLKSEPNEKKVKKLTDDIGKLNEKKQKINNQSTRKLTKILSKDQLKKLKEMDRNDFSKEGRKVTKTDMKEDLKKGMKEDLKKGMKEDLKKGMKEDLKKGMKEDLKKGMKDDLKKDMKEDLKKGMKDDLKKDMKEDIKKDIKEEHKKEKNRDKKKKEKNKR